MIFSTTNRNRKHKIAADIGNIIITTIVITVTDYSRYFHDFIQHSHDATTTQLDHRLGGNMIWNADSAAPFFQWKNHDMK